MGIPVLLRRSAISIPILIILPLLASCGSTAETTTAPSPTRCTTSVATERATFTPDGGIGTVRVTTNRECSWSAQSEAAWISVTPPLTGQGDGSVSFTVAANGDPSARAAAIKVEDQRVQISQDARPCDFRLSSTLETFDATGGDRSVQVTTTSALCTWTAASQVPWITIVGGREGRDNGTVTFHVDALAGPQRTGSITIAGQSVQVEQGAGCSYAIGTTNFSFGSVGGTGAVPVTAPAGCAWTASSAVSWITLSSGATGNGPGSVSFVVAPQEGPERTGTLSVAGRLVTVTQSPGCNYVVEPLTFAPAATASSATVNVRASPGCGWLASSGSDWITITSGDRGNGIGEVKFNIAANPGPPRSGGLQVAGQAVAVNQASGCSFTVAPTSANVAAAASTNTIQVTAATGCAWQASTATPWIAIAEGSSGSGIGRVDFSVAANTGPARQGSLTVAGRTIAVAQASGCTYAVTPPSQDVGSGAGAATVSIVTAQGCPWTASSGVDWITAATGSGSGPAQLSLPVAANPGPPRSGTVSIAEHTLTVNQASACTWAFIPPFHFFSPAGGSGNILVIVTGSCSWSATSNADWISVTTGGTGLGNGLVQFTVAPNNGAARTGTLTIGGQRYEVNQGGS